MDKKIEYWSKHQELDKFNYNISLVSFISQLSISITVLIGVLAIITSSDPLGNWGRTILAVIIVGGFIIWIKYILIKSNQIKLKRNNKSFRIREAMLRAWYQKQGVDTDLLDKQYEEIKEKSKMGIPKNKQLEIIAKEVISKSEEKNE
jgi:hypothetical protein